MVIARPINLNVSCNLHQYSFVRTRSFPGPLFPKKIRNTHPRNYHDLKGKDIDVHIKKIIYINILSLEVINTRTLFSNTLGGDHEIHCWWDLVRSKQLSSVSVCRACVFFGGSGHGNSIHNELLIISRMLTANYKSYRTLVIENLDTFLRKPVLDDLYNSV